MAKVKFKDAKRTNFVVGDKVRILPSALDVNVPKDEIGKKGVVRKFMDIQDYMLVLMDKPRNRDGYRYDWTVRPNHIELVINVGQKLQFAFMR